MAYQITKVYTFDEVAKHNEVKDCWLIIHGKVYDVTPFVKYHPGGVEVLLSATRKDATNDFEDIHHSSSAREMMEPYFVGEVDKFTVPQKGAHTPPQEAALCTLYAPLSKRRRFNMN